MLHCLTQSVNLCTFFHSNASDALDKLRFLSVTEPELMKDAIDFDIRIQADKDNGIITIT
jgi:heat shock protein beta